MEANPPRSLSPGEGREAEAVERFGIWWCSKCECSEFTTIAPAPNQRWRCDDCGNEPEGVPVRDVVWASDFDVSVAEAARLREALEGLLDAWDHDHGDLGPSGIPEALDVARSALETQGNG